MVQPGLRTVGKRYGLLDALGRGGMGTVYRARDRLTGDLVALKLVDALADRGEYSLRGGTAELGRSSRGSSSFRREVSYGALLQEFRALSQLQHPNIVRVFDYGVEAEGQAFLVMELIAPAQSLLTSGRHLARPRQMYLLVQVLRALEYLHRRHLLHLDVKPSNLLLTLSGSEPRVKVVDFGLSLLDGTGEGPEGATADQEAERERRPLAAGTRGYIAPEVLAGVSPSPASDLYALGVVATELLCGHPPFRATGLAWAGPPDLSPLSESDPLRAVLGRLLQAEPDRRFQRAADVIRALNSSEGQSWALETVGTQDSTLQSAPLCGRDRELQQLEGALRGAMAGRGSTLLICGESGIGKSRLVDELRYRALAAGVPVLRGQGQSVGGSSLHLWQAPLRALCLQLPPDDNELDALALAVPGVHELLGRARQTTPRLDAEPTPRHLREAIVSLLRRHRQPLLLLLEDLHWADHASWVVLSELLEAQRALPLLMVATYRSADQTTRSPKLPGVQEITLSRLDGGAQARLVGAMLGAAERMDPLLHLLAKEADGHPLFMLSILRELIDQAGSIAALSSPQLAARRPTESVSDALQRRLRRVPPEHRWLMRACALAGRTIDERIFRELSASSSAQDWEFWDAGSAIGVLERYEDTWRFTHELIREQLAAELSPIESREAHRAVVRAIRAAYPAAPDHAAGLALHLEHAGESAEAAEQYLLAGDYALGRGGAVDAQTYGQRIVTLLSQPRVVSAVVLQAQRLMAQSLYAQGDYVECCRQIEQAERSLHTLKQRAQPQEVRAILRREEILLLRCSEAFMWLGQPASVARRLVRTLPRIHQFEEPRAPGMLCLFLGHMASTLGAHRMGLLLCRTAGQLHARRGFTTGSIEVSRVRALIAVRRGEWELSQHSVDEVLKGADERGAATLRMHGLVAQSLSLLCQGRLPAALASAARIGSEARESRHEFFEVLGRIAEARVQIRMGSFAAVRGHVDAACQLPLLRQSLHGWIAVQSFALRLAAERSDGDEVLALAEQITQSAPGLVSALGNLFDVAELLARTLLYHLAANTGLGKSSRERPAQHRLWACYWRAAELLRRIARRIPIARPGFWLAEAELAYYQQRKAQARRCARRALQAAQRYQMPYEIACAHLLLAAIEEGENRSLTAPAGQRHAPHRQQGRELLTTLGAVWLYPLQTSALQAA